MMHVFCEYRRLVTIVLLCLGFFIGCGGGSGEDSPVSTADGDNAPAQINMAGTWQVEETVSGNCGSTDYPYTQIKIYTGTQTGNSVSFTDTLEDEVITGTLDATTLDFNSSRPDGDGTLTILGTVTCTEDGRSFSGTSQWTYNETGHACNGTAQITGTQNSDDRINATGRWIGTYVSSEYNLTHTFTADITDTDGNLTGTIDIPRIGMVVARLTGTVDGSVITFGDIKGDITFSGVFTEAGRASGTYLYDALNDKGRWEAGTGHINIGW